MIHETVCALGAMCIFTIVAAMFGYELRMLHETRASERAERRKRFKSFEGYNCRHTIYPLYHWKKFSGQYTWDDVMRMQEQEANSGNNGEP